MRRPSPMLRRWRASWRDTLLLLRQFRGPLAVFLLAILGGALLYRLLAGRAGEDVKSLAEAAYLMLALAFLQAGEGFPHAWYLQVFYFLMPLIGIGVVGLGLADFGIMLFNRRARTKEWEMAVASTFSNHIVLVGLGHLGYRVARNLREMGQDVVVVELSPEADLLASARAMGIPVLQDDGTRQAALEAAGVPRARAILLCTQNDSLNLQMGVKARSLNSRIEVIVRIFDDDFAQALQCQFGFRALSTSGMSAPSFAAAAAGMDITRPITVEGQALSLARLTLSVDTPLVGRTVQEVEEGREVSVVLLLREGESDHHPAGERRLRAGDVIAVLGSPEQLSRLLSRG